MLKPGALLFSTALLVFSPEAYALGLAEMKERTAFIAKRYLEIWSSNNTTPITGVPYMYGPSVNFYGQNYSQKQLAAEKSNVIQQWPVRHYVHRPGTMRIFCNVQSKKCAARSIIDFRASNTGRGTVKNGSAKFDLGISFAEPHPRILYESGSLNGRRADRGS